MNLKTYTAKALDEWLRGYDSKQPDDIKRFYDFVIHYRAEHGYEMDKAAIQELIRTKLSIPPEADFPEILNARIQLACRILDFLRYTRR